RHTRLQGDWSSDVCSSDLAGSNPVSPTINEFNGLAQAGSRLRRAASESRPRNFKWLAEPTIPGLEPEGRGCVMKRKARDRQGLRSEERRVGKECRSRWSQY